MKTLHLTDNQATELAYALDERVESLQRFPDSPDRKKRIEAAQSILHQITHERPMCYVTYNFYGGNARLIAQAARDHKAYLLSVKGYPLDRYPGPWDYVEGNREYVFLVEAQTPRDAWNIVTEKIYERYSELVQAAMKEEEDTYEQ